MSNVSIIMSLTVISLKTWPKNTKNGKSHKARSQGKSHGQYSFQHSIALLSFTRCQLHEKQNIDKLIKTCTWSVLPYLSARILTLGGASQILSLKKTTAATMVVTKLVLPIK